MSLYIIIGVAAVTNNTWCATVQAGSRQLQFKLDTGAEVTAISEETFCSLQDIQLQKPSRILYGPELKPLEVMGKFEQELICRGSVTKQQIFVVKGLTRNLLYTADTLSRAPIAPTQVDETPQQEAEQWMHAVVMGFQTTSTVTENLISPQMSSDSLLDSTIFIILAAVHITHREMG